MPLRVLHVVESLACEAGSAAVVLRGLIDALRIHDVESDVLLPAGRTDDPAEPLSVRRYDKSTARSLVKEHDVVHIHGWGEPVMRDVAALARAVGRPYVLSPLGVLTPGPYNRPTLKDRLARYFRDNRLIREASAVAALNEFEAEDLRRSAGLASVMVLPHGLDFAAYGNSAGVDDDLPPRPDGNCLLMLGPIDPIEGLVPLLRSLAELGRDANGWHIVLAGPERGDWRLALEAAVRRRAAEDRVMIAPAPDLTTQRAWLSRADLVAAPALHVRSPVCVLQAMAASVPVLASDRVAPPLPDDALCTCAPTQSGLKSGLRRMLTQGEADLGALGRRGRAVAASLFDWPVLVERYVKLYRGLA